MSIVSSSPITENPAPARTRIHLAPSEVPEVFKRAFPDYRGQKYTVEIRDSVTLDSNYWDGGTRYQYRGLDLLSGTVLPPDCDEYGNPFTHPGVPTVQLQPHKAIVCHKIFCGKDMGLTIYIHRENAAKLLPAPAELTAEERAALNIVCGIKGGVHRRERWSYSRLPGEYGPDNPAILSLASRKLVKVNRAGAIAPTLAGRNAR